MRPSDLGCSCRLQAPVAAGAVRAGPVVEAGLAVAAAVVAADVHDQVQPPAFAAEMDCVVASAALAALAFDV